MNWKWLPEEHVFAVHRAAIALDLDPCIGLDNDFARTLADKLSRTEQVLSNLATMNCIERLRDDSVPLRSWLNAARHLAGPRVEAEIFNLALAEMDTPVSFAAPAKARSSFTLHRRLLVTATLGLGLSALLTHAGMHSRFDTPSTVAMSTIPDHSGGLTAPPTPTISGQTPNEVTLDSSVGSSTSDSISTPDTRGGVIPSASSAQLTTSSNELIDIIKLREKRFLALLDTYSASPKRAPEGTSFPSAGDATRDRCMGKHSSQLASIRSQVIATNEKRIRALREGRLVVYHELGIELHGASEQLRPLIEDCRRSRDHYRALLRAYSEMCPGPLLDRLTMARKDAITSERASSNNGSDAAGLEPQAAGRDEPRDFDGSRWGPEERLAALKELYVALDLLGSCVPSDEVTSCNPKTLKASDLGEEYHPPDRHVGLAK